MQGRKQRLEEETGKVLQVLMVGDKGTSIRVQKPKKEAEGRRVASSNSTLVPSVRCSRGRNKSRRKPLPRTALLQAEEAPKVSHQAG